MWFVSDNGLRMAAMTKSWSLIFAVVVVLVLELAGLAGAQDDEGPMSDLRFVVVKDYNGKPIRNAAVVLHPVKKGKQSKGGLELKTDNDGKTNIDGIPYGPLRVQVLAPGFQTFGEDYEINKPELEITVKLKRPGGQYSADGGAGAKKVDDANAPAQKPPQ
jgi:Carboxypeptidase regulatory-like domain